jgi:hypothetical protein
MTTDGPISSDNSDIVRGDSHRSQNARNIHGIEHGRLNFAKTPAW